MNPPLRAAVIDSSALLCVVKHEQAASLFLKELLVVDLLFISAVTLSEALLVAMAAKQPNLITDLMRAITVLKVKTVDYVAADVSAYLHAAFRYHAKAKPPGPLNMGDLFSYQLATKMDLPLFFQGLDFLQTPVQNAMHLRGYVMNAQNKGVPTAPGP